MSGLDGLQLDADGFVAMDQFPDDGTDLVDADLDALRATLHADPIDEPTPEAWDALFDDVMAAADDGPFALDGTVDLDAADPPPFAVDDGLDTPGLDGVDDDSATPDVAPDADEGTSDDGDAVDDVIVGLLDDGGDIDLDTGGDVDLDPDLDGGLDLAPDEGSDVTFDAAALGGDDPADTSPDFEDTL